MAKSNASRSEKIDVTGAGAIALGAAWRGLYWFVNARVDQWEIVPVSEDAPEGGLIARGFSVDSDVNPSELIAHIGGRDRRLEFFPFYFYMNGEAPAEYTDPAEMQAFMTQYLKGSVEEGTNKTPEYFRQKVANYKSARGLATRRGPRRKIVRLDSLDEIDESTIANIDPAQLQAFLAKAQKVADAANTSGVATN